MAAPEVFVLEKTATETDGQGHVSNVTFVHWMLEAATGHSTAVGLTPEAYDALGCMFVVHRHDILYLRPALPGTRIEVRTWVVNFKGATTRRCYHMIDADHGDDLLRATTDWAFVNTKTGRPTRIPPEVKNAFSTYDGPFDTI
jgi:acyl-CoA thioester hydrolase